VNKKTTHFGFQRVPADDKARRVANVFTSVAHRYDIMNDLMSFGLHRLWKRYAIAASGIRAGQKILDLAGGTGDLAALILPRVGAEGAVVLCDINEAMLNHGRDRLTDKGLVGNIYYVRGNAESLPFEEDQFDCITMAFGLRNVTEKEKALASMLRSLKPGGRSVVLEFSNPQDWIAPAYDLYSFKVLPMLGKLVVGDSASYSYLAESIRMHPDQETLREMMKSVGFERCDYFDLSAGIVSVHRGYKL
jgi:demethylmenaquinone methyltransferase/2-methoxy-6-polyprenyl-1,4-benzoquinol methylase